VNGDKLSTTRIHRAAPVTLVTILALLQASRAATWYVSTNGNDEAAGADWSTAKLTIQAAIDAAATNDTVLVSNGVDPVFPPTFILQTSCLGRTRPGAAFPRQPIARQCSDSVPWTSTAAKGEI
jgi:hypothetical protein